MRWVEWEWDTGLIGVFGLINCNYKLLVPTYFLYSSSSMHEKRKILLVNKCTELAKY